MQGAEHARRRACPLYSAMRRGACSNGVAAAPVAPRAIRRTPARLRREQPFARRRIRYVFAMPRFLPAAVCTACRPPCAPPMPAVELHPEGMLAEWRYDLCLSFSSFHTLPVLFPPRHGRMCSEVMSEWHGRGMKARDLAAASGKWGNVLVTMEVCTMPRAGRMGQAGPQQLLLYEGSGTSSLWEGAATAAAWGEMLFAFTVCCNEVW